MKRLIVCYICGREFGTASIGIHEPQCIQKFHARQANLHPSERAKLPVRPLNWDKIASGDQAARQEAMEEYNQQADEAFRNQRSTCPHCDRGFYPAERLEVHLRTCGPDSHFAREANRKKQASTQKQTAYEASVAATPKMPALVDKKPSTQPSASSARFCTECGTKFAEAANFCGSCGVKRAVLSR